MTEQKVSSCCQFIFILYIGGTKHLRYVNIISYNILFKLVQWTIGTDLRKPFKRCLTSRKLGYRRGCPTVSGGPFTDSKGKCAKYFLWKLAFKFGPVNESHSEHTIEGKP